MLSAKQKISSSIRGLTSFHFFFESFLSQFESRSFVINDSLANAFQGQKATQGPPLLFKTKPDLDSKFTDYYLLQKLYTNKTAEIRFNKAYSRHFIFKKGVSQGESSFPYLLLSTLNHFNFTTQHKDILTLTLFCFAILYFVMPAPHHQTLLT